MSDLGMAQEIRKDFHPFSFPDLDKHDKSFTREVCLRILQKIRRPLRANELADYALQAGSSVRPASLLANVGQYWSTTKNGWEFVHREEVALKDGFNRKAFTYRYDDSIPARVKGYKVQKSQKSKLPAVHVEKVKETPVGKVSVNHGQEAFAMVIYSDDETVILLDQKKQVIQGRYLK